MVTRFNFILAAALYLLSSSFAFAQTPASFDDLVQQSISALQKNDQAAFMALFITNQAMEESVTTQVFPSNPAKRQKVVADYQQRGKKRIQDALDRARKSTWNDLHPAGMDWSKAQVKGVEPAYNRSDGIEKTDWARITLMVKDKLYILKFNQARVTPAGWRLVFGATLKGPMARQ
jgi:hypothetical protein